MRDSALGAPPAAPKSTDLDLCPLSGLRSWPSRCILLFSLFLWCAPLPQRVAPRRKIQILGGTRNAQLRCRLGLCRLGLWLLLRCRCFRRGRRFRGSGRSTLARLWCACRFLGTSPGASDSSGHLTIKPANAIPNLVLNGPLVQENKLANQVNLPPALADRTCASTATPQRYRTSPAARYPALRKTSSSATYIQLASPGAVVAVRPWEACAVRPRLHPRAGYGLRP